MMEGSGMHGGSVICSTGRRWGVRGVKGEKEEVVVGVR